MVRREPGGQVGAEKSGGPQATKTTEQLRGREVLQEGGAELPGSVCRGNSPDHPAIFWKDFGSEDPASQ